MRDRLQVSPTLDAVEFRTEEDDPVLLLPDHLAGVIHYRTAPAVIENPPPLGMDALELRCTSSR